MTILPTITILLFSVNHIIDKYRTYDTHEHLIESSKLINNTTNVLHELQLERGFISSYINSKTPEHKNYFKDMLDKQQQKTDKVIDEFNLFIKYINSEDIQIINKKFTEKITMLLQSIEDVRRNIANNIITPYESFIHFSYINSQLLELADGIKFYSNDNKTQNNIMTLKKLLIFQEASGQERAFVELLINKKVSPQSLEKLEAIWYTQDNAYQNVKILLDDSTLSNNLNNIDKKEANSYIQNTRQKIKESQGKEFSIDAKVWFDSATNRIDDYHKLGRYIFSQILDEITSKNNTLYNSFIYQLLFTVITLSALLVGVSLIARNIDDSLRKLDNGMNDFFDFLNFKTDTPKDIDTDSKDELSNIAEKTNRQIHYIQNNLDNDKHFIQETTHIVNQMRDGDFSNKLRFNPTNPALIELKVVFNNLIKLISNKIAEQTSSLEALNQSLEEKVYQQTAELEKQILEITEARDAAIEAERSKDIFLANMSHEIRTPLNAILGFVTILKKRIKDETSLDYLSIVDSSGKSLLNVINDILDFSKIQSGKLNITPHNIDPVAEFGNTIHLFASKAYEKHLTYAVYIDPNLPKEISVDEDRIKQILSNLLSNAIKFTPENGIISVYIVIKDGFIIMSVQDNGIGIPIESQTEIFNSFSQADSSTTKKYGGTGLGLSISLKLAEIMGGNISLVSQEGVGSTFTLKIPIKIMNDSREHLMDLDKIKKYNFAVLNTCKEHDVFTKLIKKYLHNFGIEDIIELSEFKKEGYDILFFVPDESYNRKIIDNDVSAIAILKSNLSDYPDSANITPLYAPFTPTSIIETLNDIIEEDIHVISGEDAVFEEGSYCEIKYGGSVLVAEDNKTNQLLISLILDDYDIDHHIVDNGKEAVEIFKKKKFDLILMDENMPELNGIGAMQQIKEYEMKNNLKKTPIIAVTANALATDVKKFIDAGMDGFVAKPINNELLEIELDKHLKRLQT